MNLEVELRTFLSKEKYEDLLGFFAKEGQLLKEDYQETFYFSGEADLRIQQNKTGAKIWLKKGKIHDDSREEIELPLAREDFAKAEQLFLALDYEVEIKWFRTRHEFLWQGITVCVDFTKGYGYILELEKMVDEAGCEAALAELHEKMADLKIEISPRSEFEEKFAYYKENWQELVK